MGNREMGNGKTKYLKGKRYIIDDVKSLMMFRKRLSLFDAFKATKVLLSRVFSFKSMAFDGCRRHQINYDSY